MIKVAGISDMGMKRTQNQDNMKLLEDVGLFIVADGMGGHKGGEIASEIAVQTISTFFKNNGDLRENPIECVRRAIAAANDAIQVRGRTDASLQGMGTTAVVMFFKNQKLFVGHVGDSRCYLLQKNKIWQLTRDHSLVQEKLRAGIITREQLKTDKMKNVITRSVGFEAEVEIDVYQFDCKPGDVFLACSDGLSGMLDDEEILAIVDSEVFGRGDVKIAAQKLIDTANQNGGDDNVTAVVVQVV